MAVGIAGMLPSLAMAESSGNPRAVNRTSGAAGLFQFLPSTWADLGKRFPDLGLNPGNIFDEGKQRAAAERYYTTDVAPRMAGLGIDPSAETLYPFWVFGPTGGQKMFQAYQANPDTPAAQVVSERALTGNGLPADATVGEAVAWAAKRVSGARAAPPGVEPDYTHRDKTVRELQEFQRSAPPMLPPRPGAGIASLAQPTAQPQAPPRAGIASLLQPNSPYMQLANQIAPSRQVDPWSTLGQIGAAMASSRSPTFLGGLAEGMGHGSQYVDAIGRENDALDRSRYEIAMKMAQLDQREDKPVALAKGAKLVDPRTGRTVAEGNRDEGEFATMLRDAGIDPQSAEGLQLTRAYAQRKGSPTNVSTVVQSGEKAYDTTIGKALAEQRVTIAADAASAPKIAAQADQLGALLDQAGTGALTPALTNLTAIGRSLGVNVDSLVGVNTPAAEAARILAQEISLKYIEQTKGSISNAEMKIFLGMSPNLANTPETNRLLIDTMKVQAHRALLQDQAAQEYEAEKGRLDFGFNKVRDRIFAENPLPVIEVLKRQSSAKPAASPPAATTAAPAAPGAAPAIPAPITSPSPTLPPKFDPNTAPRITNDAAGKAAYDALPPGSFFQVPDVRGGWTTRWKAQ